MARKMPVKAPPPAPAPVYSWTGLYVGANIGVGVAQDGIRSLGGFPAGPTAFFGEQTDSAPTGVIGGLQIGYNWQSTPNWVWGVETDFQGSSQQDSICIVGCDTYLGVSSGGAPTFQTIKQSIDWFGTLRGRAGWTNGPALFYVTGGWAYAGIETKTADSFGFIGGAPQGAFNFNDTRSGWTIGGGIESHLFGNWTGKIESVRNNVVRAGLNYKFGPEQGPTAPAPSLPAMYWTGAYAGLNLGYGVEASPATFAFGFLGGPIVNNENFKFAAKGVVGGGQVGYNWQLSNNWVGGLETDIQGSGQQSGTSCLAICGGFFAPPQFANLSQKITWLGTTRARLGWASGPALYYATGGVAYGHIETNVNQQYFGLALGGPASFQFRSDKDGLDRGWRR
jgi:outer membrane immunogenic protein